MRKSHLHIFVLLSICILFCQLSSCTTETGKDKSELIHEGDSLSDLALDKLDSCHFEEAIYLNRIAITKYKKAEDWVNLGDTWVNLSTCYFRIGEINKALEAAIEGFRLDSIEQDKNRMGQDYSIIAAIYLGAGKCNKAKTFIEKSIETELELDKPERLSVIYGTAAEIYNKAGEFEKALKFAEDAYKLDLQDKDSLKMARRQSQMADIYRAMNNYEVAESLYAEANKIFETKHNLVSLCINQKQLGNLYKETGKNGESIECFEKSADIARGIGNKYILQQATEQLASLYQQTQPTQALALLQESLALKDSIYSEKTNQLTEEYAARYETQKKDQIIKEQNERLHHQRSAIIIIIIIAVLLLLLMAVLFSLRKLRLNNLRLHKKYTTALVENPEELTERKEEKANENKKDNQKADKERPQRTAGNNEKENTTKADRDFLVRVIQAINTHIEDTSLSSLLLSEEICLSQRQLNRKIKDITGNDTSTFIRNIRIQLAKRLLTDTDEPIGNIYIRCGFDSQSYFSKIFKQTEGMTPTEFRRNYKHQS